MTKCTLVAKNERGSMWISVVFTVKWKSCKGGLGLPDIKTDYKASVIVILVLEQTDQFTGQKVQKQT